MGVLTIAFALSLYANPPHNNNLEPWQQHIQRISPFMLVIIGCGLPYWIIRYVWPDVTTMEQLEDLDAELNRQVHDE